MMRAASSASLSNQGDDIRVGPSQWPTNSCTDLLQPSAQIIRHPSCPSESYRLAWIDVASEAMAGRFLDDPESFCLPKRRKPTDVYAD
jgi:hypothetical protein